MKPTRQLATLGFLVALVALGGCVWERGMHGREYDRRGGNGQPPNSYQRDRDGRPCGDGDRHEGDRRDGDRRDDERHDQHDQDCHRGEH